MTRTPVRLPAPSFDYDYERRLREELKALRTDRYCRVGLWFGLRPEVYVTSEVVAALDRAIADDYAAWEASPKDHSCDAVVATIYTLCDRACPDIMAQVPDSARAYFADGLIDGSNLRALGITITEGALVVGPIHAPVYSCRAEFTKDAPAALAGLGAADPHLVLHRYNGGWLGASLEFESRLSLAEINQILLDVERSLESSHKGIELHVMRESLRACPLQSNSLERTYMDKPEALVTDEERRAHEEEMAKYR
jgi:hypothetical protein